MNKELKFYKRYEKFKEHSLPTPVWDDERKVLEYVYYDNSVIDPGEKYIDTGVRVDPNIVDSLGDICYINLIYTFTSKYFVQKNGVYNAEVGKSHAHSFQEVVRNLYDFPESFKIQKEDIEHYSRQQLQYLRRVQKYLLFLGLKDIESYQISHDRYKNAAQYKYNKAFIYEYPKKTIEEFKNHTRNFIVNEYNDRYHNEEEKEVNYYALITDELSNFKLYVNFTLRKVVSYAEIKDIYKDEKLTDDDKVVITYFEILEEF